MKTLLLISVISMIAGCSTVPSMSSRLDDQTPKGAIEQAQAAQASQHTWLWWAGGAIATGLVVASAHRKSDTPSTADQGTNNSNSVCVTTVCNH